MTPYNRQILCGGDAKTGRKEILQQRQISPSLPEEKPVIGLAGVKPVQQAGHAFSPYGNIFRINLFQALSTLYNR
jgi:hypothetical protein